MQKKKWNTNTKSFVSLLINGVAIYHLQSVQHKWRYNATENRLTSNIKFKNAKLLVYHCMVVCGGLHKTKANWQSTQPHKQRTAGLLHTDSSIDWWQTSKHKCSPNPNTLFNFFCDFKSFFFHNVNCDEEHLAWNDMCLIFWNQILGIKCFDRNCWRIF